MIQPLSAAHVPGHARLLDRLHGLLQGPTQVVWIGAPVGMGKSALARAWLGAHAGRLHAAVADEDPRQSWAALFAAPAPARAVLDNLHLVGPEATWAPWLSSRIETLPSGVCMLLLSRRPPPGCLARLQLQRRLVCLPAEELLLTADEAAAMGMPAAAAGWPAAAGLPADVAASAALLRSLIDTEVLADVNPADQALLRHVAWLPGAVGPAAVEGLSGLSDAGGRLEWLCDHGLLAWRVPGGIRLHPALRRRLLETGADGDLAWRAAWQWLQQPGRCEGDAVAEAEAEAIELALDAAEAGHADALALADAALVHAAERWIAGCRHAELARQLRRLPPAGRSPRAWAALASALAASEPAAARDAAMQALEQLPAEASALRLNLLTQVIGSYFQTFDSTEPLSRWLALVPQLPEPVAPDAAAALAVAGFSALFLREPAHPDMPAWQRRAMRLPDADVDPNIRLRATMLLCKQAWYTGQHASLAHLPQRAQGALRDPRTTPYARLLWGLARQYLAWGTADAEAGRLAGAEALALARQHQLHTLDRHLRLHDACLAQMLGLHDDAQAQMGAAAQGFDGLRRMEAWHFHSVQASLQLEQGEAARALEAASLARDAAEAMGPAPLAMSLFIAGQAQVALTGPVHATVEQLQKLAARDTNPRAALAADWLLGAMAWCHGRRDEALVATGRALARTMTLGGGAWFGLHRNGIAPLLAAALQAGVEPAAAAALVRAMRIEPPPEADASWPWPVRIGGGVLPRIHVHDLPVVLGPKAPMRPLQLLQELLAFGGRAPAARLADRLWPGAEGDRAMASFEVALRRLRALLELPDALLLTRGELALNRRCVWVEPDAMPAVSRRALVAGQMAD